MEHAHVSDNPQSSATPAELAALAELGPEVQGVVDRSLLAANLRLSPTARLLAAQKAATDLERMRHAFKARTHA